VRNSQRGEERYRERYYIINNNKNQKESIGEKVDGYVFNFVKTACSKTEISWLSSELNTAEPGGVEGEAGEGGALTEFWEVDGTRPGRVGLVEPKTKREGERLCVPLVAK
jgi:hypothetical protein